MPRSRYLDPLSVARIEEEVRTFHANLRWFSLENSHPVPCRWVLVRLDDARVLSAAYYRDHGWYFGPFHRAGSPVAWAEMAPGHSTSQ
jgi:hypothetical protein